MQGVYQGRVAETPVDLSQGFSTSALLILEPNNALMWGTSCVL